MRTRTDEPYLLVLEDFPLGATAIERSASRYVSVRVVATAAEGWALLTSSRPPGGVILDDVLRDGRGTAMFEKYREGHGYSLPAIVMSGLPSRQDIAVDPWNVHARYLSKPTRDLRAISTFAASISTRAELDALIEEWAPPSARTEARGEVLQVASWAPRNDLPDVLGRSDRAVKARLGELFPRLGVSSYEAIQAALDPITIFDERARRPSGARLALADLMVPSDSSQGPGPSSA